MTLAFFDTCSRHPDEANSRFVVAEKMARVRTAIRRILSAAEHLGAPVLSTTCLGIQRCAPGMCVRSSCGALAPGSPLSRETLTTTVTVGSVSQTAVFAGMAPGFAGLVQVNFMVPNLATGDYPLQVTIGAAASNQPLVAVSQ